MGRLGIGVVSAETLCVTRTPPQPGASKRPGVALSTTCE